MFIQHYPKSSDPLKHFYVSLHHTSDYSQRISVNEHQTFLSNIARSPVSFHGVKYLDIPCINQKNGLKTIAQWLSEQEDIISVDGTNDYVNLTYLYSNIEKVKLFARSAINRLKDQISNANQLLIFINSTAAQQTYFQKNEDANTKKYCEYLKKNNQGVIKDSYLQANNGRNRNK
jgi:hypothetical protein